MMGKGGPLSAAVMTVVFACYAGDSGSAAGDTTATSLATSTGGVATRGSQGDDAPQDSTATGDPPPTGSATGTTAPGDADTGEPTGLGPLVVDTEHPHVFRREGGDPVFLCGPAEAEDFLYRGELLPDGTRDGDQDALIAKVAASGANVVAVIAVRSHGGDGDATQNPWVGNDPAQGLDEAVLDQWEGWFTAFDEAGIVTMFFVYDDMALVWDTGDAVGADEQAFVEALVDRFGHHPLLEWVVAENYEIALSATRASSLAAVIAARDDAGHPIAIGQDSGLEFDFPDDPAVDSFAARYDVSSASEVHDGLVSIFPAAQDRWNVTMSQVDGTGTGDQARTFSWAAAMAGAYVTVYGQDIATTDPADLEDCGRLADFFVGTRFPELSPHDELATGDTRWVFARPAEAYVLFGVNDPVELGLSDLPAAGWVVHWFDPAAGTRIDEMLRHPGGPAMLSVPAGFGIHAALYLELG